MVRSTRNAVLGLAVGAALTQLSFVAPAHAATSHVTGPAGTSTRSLSTIAGRSSTFDNALHPAAIKGIRGRFARPSQLATAPRPYVEWVENDSPLNVPVTVYWAQNSGGGVRQAGGSLAPGQVSPFVLAACGDVAAYVIQANVGGELIGTPVEYPSQPPSSTDGDNCADFWAIG